MVHSQNWPLCFKENNMLFSDHDSANQILKITKNEPPYTHTHTNHTQKVNKSLTGHFKELLFDKLWVTTKYLKQKKKKENVIDFIVIKQRKQEKGEKK